MAGNASEFTASSCADGNRDSGSSALLSDAEKRAKSTPSVHPSMSLPSAGVTPTTASGTESGAPPLKLRSCVICRSRKVRCDKQSPCSNCRRAGTPCVIPSTDRPPRWAKRLERVAHNAAAEERLARAADSPTAQVMERLHNLEGLVKELTKQLEQANALVGSSTGDSPASSANDRDGEQQQQSAKPTGGMNTANNIQSHFGRLVLSDARYVSSGFWSRVNDELDEIKLETQHLAEDDLDSSEDEGLSHAPPPTRELERTSSERHAFLFRHNLSTPTPDLHELHPLPSQVPFLLDVFAENVNFIRRIIHMPTVSRMARQSMIGGAARPTPANQALLFAIYYATITSMDDKDVLSNFGATKADLNLKYRLGLEHALAEADFMTVPNIILVQAFTIFLSLVRRHDSPRFVWMMTGIVLRMGQALGLQRDGSHFKHLNPYDVEIRRRVWYALCALDVRASEDQGTEYTIQLGSFDTRLPLNINEEDIDPNRKETPTEREGITDMTISIIYMEIGIISRKVMVPGISLEEQNRLLSTIHTTLERRYLQFSKNPRDMSWIMVVVARLLYAKMTLLTHLPVLFLAPGDNFSDEVRNKLLVAAIEVAEFNHTLNAERAARQWRWIYQTYTHWHAIVYALIDICRRPWSPIAERAWLALQSPWLIPTVSKSEMALRTWIPLRMLMMKSRRHRDAELERLRNDPATARQLEMADSELPVPLTDGIVSPSFVAETFREKWRMLVEVPDLRYQQSRGPSAQVSPQGAGHAFPDPAILGQNYNIPGTSFNHQPNYAPHNYSNIHEPFAPPTMPDSTTLDQQFIHNSQSQSFMTADTSWYGTQPETEGLNDWFGVNIDVGMDTFVGADVDIMNFDTDVEGAMNWHNWVQSLQGMEMFPHAHDMMPGS